MDGADRLEGRKTLAERLGWTGMACCGATWGIRPSTFSTRDDEDEVVVGPLQPQQQNQPEEQQIEVVDVSRTPPETNSDPGCDSEGPVVSGMNLADALAAERQFRAADLDGASGLSPNPSLVRPNSDVTTPETPLRMSLMRLLEETDGGDEAAEKGEKGVGNDSVCCVCMGRKKGAAFIPCGHTFCRVCSRELWLNRGSCPLCNRSILEILDIF